MHVSQGDEVYELTYVFELQFLHCGEAPDPTYPHLKSDSNVVTISRPIYANLRSREPSSTRPICGRCFYSLEMRTQVKNGIRIPSRGLLVN